MRLPVMPPVAPMLARAVSAIPDGAMSYEPKWDGFRAIVFRDGTAVEITSRNERSLTRYFPEIVAAMLENVPERCVLDGEIVLPDDHGRSLDFEALLARVHPAPSRVRLLATRTPAAYVAFDMLALGDRDLTGEPFSLRRSALRDALSGARPPVYLTPATTRAETAHIWFRQFEGAGLDGIIAKPLGDPYRQGKRAMFKVKHERTADCVVAGYRPYRGDAEAVGSLLLGLYDDAGSLASVGVVGAFAMARRRKLFTDLAPLVTTFDQHPWRWEASETKTRHPRGAEASRWNAGKDLSFVPLHPERVVEVRYDHMQGTRFRHTTQFVRWRPDRDPASCRFDQLEEPVSFNLGDILPDWRADGVPG